jgi:hypothetical protein
VKFSGPLHVDQLLQLGVEERRQDVDLHDVQVVLRRKSEQWNVPILPVGARSGVAALVQPQEEGHAGARSRAVAQPHTQALAQAQVESQQHYSRQPAPDADVPPKHRHHYHQAPGLACPQMDQHQSDRCGALTGKFGTFRTLLAVAAEHDLYWPDCIRPRLDACCMPQV